MGITTDSHVHTLFSVDGSASMEQMCAAAVNAGMETIVFTEHKDFIEELPGKDHFDYTAYMQAVEECRKKFSPRLAVKAGVEVDFSSAYAQEAVSFVEEHAFDFTIGSVHYLGTDPVSEERAAAFFAEAPRDYVMDFYWKEVTACVETGVFDAIGHLDMVKRHSLPFYGPFRPELYAKQLRRILSLVRDTGAALEINTSGLRHAPGEMYPAPFILRLYRDMGGRKVTVGSDAHVPEHVGYAFDAAESTAARLGFTIRDAAT